MGFLKPVSGFVASIFLDFLSFFDAMFVFPFFESPVWADASLYASCSPMSPAAQDSAKCF
jgi:hypothetical protein